MTQMLHANEFFEIARERYNIKLRREAGLPYPWTKDKILRDWRFTHIHREDDKTTIWMRENVRGPLSEICRANPTPETRLAVVKGTLIFRWFNRIETGQIIKDLLLDKWDSKVARDRLKDIHPVTTGAYIIRGEDGYDKMNGVVAAIDRALPRLPKMVPKWGATLEEAWNDLCTLDYIGGFMAHETVTDLNHTVILENASDDMTWSNLGPGAIRGLGRVVNGDPEFFANSKKGQKEMLVLAQELLAMAQLEEFWPKEWKPWKLHQVEMTLCEFCKYCNAQDGKRLKRSYKPS